MREANLAKEKIKAIIDFFAMLNLDKEDYGVLYELYFKNTSIHQLSKNFGITRSAVRWWREGAKEDEN